jgi:S-DNA-T family DNA segregation ATPase FtsK/SpoIIIE
MASAAVDRAPLLPASLEERLRAWLLKAVGFLVLLACLAGALSLLTWSVVDPSLTHATGGFTRNALGPLGAILSDILMQMLGFAGVLVLLPPLFWGLQLVISGRLDSVRPKMVLAPVAVLLLAAALSALPTASAWPLHHGFGGLVGDMTLALMAQFLAVINPQRAFAVAGLFYCAAGLLVMMASLGLSRRDLSLICRRSPASTLPRATVRGFSRAWRFGRDIVQARREPMFAPEERFEPSFAPEPPRLEMPAPSVPAPILAPAPFVPEPYFEAPHPPEVHDDVTDGSRAIAERFAPVGVASTPSVAGDLELPLPAAPRMPPPVRSDVSTAYRQPPLTMLRPAAPQRAETAASQRALRDQAQMLVSVLQDFGVKGEVRNIHPGPVVTLFEFEPARGTKSSRIIGLADDVARSMSAASARIAVIPGRNAIGIELPNLRRETVYLRELLEADAFRASKAALPLALGKGIDGAPAFADLARMPHLLVAGTTGSGKSVGINAMILSLLFRHSPDQCRFLMIDPKMLELSVYNGIPHLLAPVVTESQKAIAALNWAVREMEDRYQRMSKLGVRNIEAYNARVRDAAPRGGLTTRFGGGDAEFSPLPYIVIVVDEFADLMIVAGKEIESAVQRLAQMARAAGIHLIMATQRPSVDIITGTIKANFPMRISFKVASRFDSRTIINEHGAEQLLGEGDMLFAGGSGRVLRVHGPFVSDDEVEGIVGFLRTQGEPRYVEGITDVPEVQNALEAQRADSDDLYERALAIVMRDRKASISYLQRRLSIGYNRAASLIERLEEEGIIGPPSFKGGRPVLVGGPTHDL